MDTLGHYPFTNQQACQIFHSRRRLDREEMISLLTRSGILDLIIKCETFSLLVIRVLSIRDLKLSRVNNHIHIHTLSRRSRRVLHSSICLDHQIISINDRYFLTEARSMSSTSTIRMTTSWSSWRKGRRSSKQVEGRRMIRNRSMSMRSSTIGSSRGGQQGRDLKNSTG